ncbi:hypothetical protein SALBM217S_07580 [Streptomyces griseoloalbus]
MVHASLSGTGAAPETVRDALLDALGPGGTLVVPAFTPENPATSRPTEQLIEGLHERAGRAFRATMPPYDPATTPCPTMGALAAMRTDHTRRRAQRPPADLARRTRPARARVARRPPSPLPPRRALPAGPAVRGGRPHPPAARRFRGVQRPPPRRVHRMTSPPPRRTYRCVVGKRGNWVEYEDAALDDSDFATVVERLPSDLLMRREWSGRPVTQFRMRRVVDDGGPSNVLRNATIGVKQPVRTGWLSGTFVDLGRCPDGGGGNGWGDVLNVPGRERSRASDDQPYFFLSYAHTPRVGNGGGDPDHWVCVLYQDLCSTIMQLTDAVLPPYPPGTARDHGRYERSATASSSTPCSDIRPRRGAWSIAAAAVPERGHCAMRDARPSEWYCVQRAQLRGRSRRRRQGGLGSAHRARPWTVRIDDTTGGSSRRRQDARATLLRGNVEIHLPPVLRPRGAQRTGGDEYAASPTSPLVQPSPGG